MGFAGAHIGGRGPKCEDVESVLDQGDELSLDRRSLATEFNYPQPNGWCFFETGSETGLNPDTLAGLSGRRPGSPPSYRGFRLLHRLMFDERGPSTGRRDPWLD